MNNADFKQFLESFYGDISKALFDRITEAIDSVMEEETDVCPHCGRCFLQSEDALRYEQDNGEYTCECLSPESQIAALEDMWREERQIKG